MAGWIIHYLRNEDWLEINLGTRLGAEVNFGLPLGIGLNGSAFANLDLQYELDGVRNSLTISVGPHLHGWVTVSGSIFGVEVEKQYLGFDLEGGISHTFKF